MARRIGSIEEIEFKFIGENYSQGALKCNNWFDAIAVSAEGVNPEDAVRVGDDRRNDICGARDANYDAWLWGSYVHSFKEVAERVEVCLKKWSDKCN